MMDGDQDQYRGSIPPYLAPVMLSQSAQEIVKKSSFLQLGERISLNTAKLISVLVLNSTETANFNVAL